ncbi:hotdog domain-containing protein [Bacillus sp. DTU_2020_1000418_1_SI_GHA_SEK_038]|uniref:acyl-CoA thioesterase n=1 Tax=Bacillus sp. DTU_2020_1000418_1_SI_GHA_SEK_038 TaxID=3077585 RepID=UPI0028EC3363|nr:thioesterase family protein [Bacillus sp. DTU_2020_1000418_1_SI_GHA_SEK_038]WNS76189.1 hotdog domain-containing protein [Bacillus sp. DTU_2020_1000418_1_SI_GHA_SEK_038]
MSGHINNESYCIYFEQAWGEYLNSINFFNSHVTAVTADLWCHYHQEAFFPDNLKVGVRVVALGSKKMDLEYYIIFEDESLIATARGTLVIIDKKTNRSTTILKEIQDSIKIIEGLELVSK